MIGLSDKLAKTKDILKAENTKRKFSLEKFNHSNKKYIGIINDLLT